MMGEVREGQNEGPGQMKTEMQRWRGGWAARRMPRGDIEEQKPLETRGNTHNTHTDPRLPTTCSTPSVPLANALPLHYGKCTKASPGRMACLPP